MNKDAELFLVNETVNMFVKQDVSLSLPSIVASILTASSEMAKYSDIITEEELLQVLEPLFNPTDDEQVKKLIGLNPDYVENNIGYHVNFRDYASATAEYNSQKEKYDKLYNSIKNYDIIHQNNIK